MIKPEDITAKTAMALNQYGKESGKEVRAGIALSCLRRTNENADEIELVEQFCKFEIWHGLYGDVFQALQKMRQEVLYNVPNPFS